MTNVFLIRENYVKILVGFSYVTLITFSFSNFATAYEEPKYNVLRKDGTFELRQYKSQIVAETVIGGDFKEAGNKAFRMLFKYISGHNKAQQEIEMTTPVEQELSSQKIKMTVPVSQEQTGERWRISFFMPPQFTLATIPEPIDSKINIREMPGRLVAVLRYSGTWSKRRYDSKVQELYELLSQYGLEPVGMPILARYNSPFTLWFLRRNEVIIEVQEITQ